jgi:hypothetical protein
MKTKQGKVEVCKYYICYSFQNTQVFAARHIPFDGEFKNTVCTKKTRCIAPQRTLHPPQEQKTRARVPPGNKVFRKKHSNTVVYNLLNRHCLHVYFRNKDIRHKKKFFCVLKNTTKV